MSANAPNPGENEPPNIDKMLVSYLQTKGFRATEAIFLRELRGETVSLQDASAINKVDTTQQQQQQQQQQSEVMVQDEEEQEEDEEEDPDMYGVSYNSLREWIENSLDWYKPELRSVLFPIFVHSYLDLVSKGLPDKAQEFMKAYRVDHVELHTPDLNTFASITELHHIRENEIAQMYRNNKYNLRMSGVPFELFLNYLQDNRFMLLLRIVNQYLNIQGGLELEDDVIGITGHQTQQLEEFNRQRVQLGLLQFEPSFKEEVEQAIKEEEQNGQKKKENEEVSPLLDIFKKEIQEYSLDGPSPHDVPLPPYRGTDIRAEIEHLKDVSQRLALNETSLPSICCYTFHNTHDSLNCVTMTKDATLIAGGFSQSFIKIWSLKGEKLRSLRNTINPAHVNDYNDLNRQRERHGSDYKRLIGHSGPIYGLSFSPDNKYLLSCSEDKTVRLWSTQTYSNLVVFKGHNSPIWDVEFGPFGFYFATASHDRTARLWSLDHISPLRIFTGHLSDVDTIKFHPNSKYVATGSSDRTCRLWDIHNGNCVRVFTGHTGAVKAVAISPNGKLMASAGEDKSILLWDLKSGKKIKKMTGHTGFIYSIQFSADSNILVSGGSDCTVRVWDVNTSHDDNMVDSTLKKRRLQEDEGYSKRVYESRDQLGVFPTKQTPIYNTQFTDRNLCLVSGAFKV
ncbi:hypothetical protein RMCBS344292_03530 [Rhizopus microsporus]|nr:hypothetical protein RMCBS344292_03530 [Rhizopus microsporus]